MSRKRVRITHRSSGEVVAEGPVGWGVTPFEGNWYVGDRYLRTAGFSPNWLPGFCPYKFFYVGLDFRAKDGSESRGLGWRYVLPNPLLPFIAFRVAVPGDHPDLEIEVTDASLQAPVVRRSGHRHQTVGNRRRPS